MAIGVTGQFLFQFSIGGKKDFIDEHDFIDFTLVEEAGNALPTFHLAFNTQDDSVIPLLNEGNTLQVSFGKDFNSIISVPLAVTGMDVHREGHNKNLISVTGVYGAIPYLSNNKVLITTAKSGVEVLKDTTKKYFTWMGNIDKSADSQQWAQYNISDRAFVNNVWMHSDISNSFIAVGISSDGNFICKDIKKDLGNPYTWRFGRIVEDDKRDIIIDGDPAVNIKTGLMNAWMGYGRERLVYNMETSLNTMVLEQQSAVTAITASLAKSKDVQARFASVGIQNDNVHPNYWRAYQRNLTNLSAFLNVAVTVSFQNKFVPVRVLDQAMYKASSPTTMNQSSEYLSGIYYVTKVVRSVNNSQMVTSVQLNRESLNQVRVGM
jgi:hypothetical protein